jgi:hypothetical protein
MVLHTGRRARRPIGWRRRIAAQRLRSGERSLVRPREPHRRTGDSPRVYTLRRLHRACVRSLRVLRPFDRARYPGRVHPLQTLGRSVWTDCGIEPFDGAGDASRVHPKQLLTRRCERPVDLLESFDCPCDPRGMHSESLRPSRGDQRTFCLVALQRAFIRMLERPHGGSREDAGWLRPARACVLRPGRSMRRGSRHSGRLHAEMPTGSTGEASEPSGNLHPGTFLCQTFMRRGQQPPPVSVFFGRKAGFPDGARHPPGLYPLRVHGPDLKTARTLRRVERVGATRLRRGLERASRYRPAGASTWTSDRKGGQGSLQRPPGPGQGRQAVQDAAVLLFGLERQPGHLRVKR